MAKTVGIQNGFKLVYGKGITLRYGEAAGSTFKVGDPLRQDGAGRIEDSLESENQFAIALENSNGVTDHVVNVMLITHDLIWSINQSNAGAADVYELTMAGDRYGYIKSTQTSQTDKMTLDFADTGNEVLELIRVDERDAIGDTNARVWVRWVPAKIVAAA